MSTIRDVAKAAGVSVATVSRVLNQNGYVRGETEKRVREAIEQLHFETNEVARGLANKKTNTIALILPNISNPFFAEIARAIEDRARSYNYTVIFCNSDLEGVKEISYLEIIKRRYIDGVIFASNMVGKDTINYLNKNKIERVVLDRTLPNDNSTTITSNNYEGALVAMKHLLDAGCQKIAHIHGPKNLKTSMDRQRGYEETVKSYEWFEPSLLVPGDFTMSGGTRAIAELFEKHPDVDGIFAGNDLMAIGAVKGLLQRGMKIPDDIVVCGFDGIELTTMIEPEITTVAQPIYQMGALAVDALMRRMSGAEEQGKLYELDTRLIERKSTQRKLRP